jgi:hypothetical protein
VLWPLLLGRGTLAAAVTDVPLPNGVDIYDQAGAASESAAINALLASAGRRVLLGGGTSGLRASILAAQNSLNIEGAVGRGANILSIDDSLGNIGDGARWTNVGEGSISNLTITALSTRSAGAGIRVRGGNPSDPLDGVGYPSMVNAGMLIQDVDMANQFDGIVIDSDTSANYYGWRTYVRGGRFKDFAAGGTGITVDVVEAGVSPGLGASQFVENWWFSQAPANTLAGIRLRGTGDCTLTNNEVYGAQYALLMDPPANGFLTSVTVNGGFYDRSDLACLRIAPDASVGKFGAITFNGTWFAGCTAGDVAQIVGVAAKNIKFMGCTFDSAEAAGKWCAVVDAASNVDFIGCTFAGGNAGGLKFTGNASNFKVIGCTFSGAGIGTGPITTMPIGIQVDAGCDHYTIAGNDLSDGAVSTKITNTPGTSASRRIVQDNVTA